MSRKLGYAICHSSSGMYQKMEGDYFKMPTSFISLIILMAFILICFLVIKRPIYEIMVLGYIVTIICTGRYDVFWKNLIKPSTNSLFFAVVAFLLLAHILDETGVIQQVIDIVLSFVGRFPGGAGYVAVAISTFMSALSGTGPGNVAATGVFTIPAMKKTGFPAELAANIETSASFLGPMIPPSGTILLAYGILNEFLPESQQIPMSRFWMIVWGVGLWYILQRVITTWLYCRHYKVQPMPKEDIKPLSESLRTGWAAALLPIIILAPFVIDAVMKPTLTNLVTSAGAKAFSDTLLIFTPGVAVVYCMLISRTSVKKIFDILKDSFSSIVPVAATVYFSYSIAYVFGDIGMDKALAEVVTSFQLPKIALIFVTILFFAIIATILPGSGSLAIFGGSFLAIFAKAGVDPILIAAVLPALTGALSGMVPPVAVALYTAVGIAQSDIGKTINMSLVWTGAHLLVTTMIMLGLLPILGL